MAESLPLNSTWLFLLNQGNLIPRYDYDANGNVTYMGWAQPGTPETDSAWRIFKNTVNGSNQITGGGFPGDANGNASCAFSFQWSQRTSYTYS